MCICWCVIQLDMFVVSSTYNFSCLLQGHLKFCKFILILLKIMHVCYASTSFQPKLLIVLFYVLSVCKCVLYYCHRVATQLQLTNISKSKFCMFIALLLQIVGELSNEMQHKAV